MNSSWVDELDEDGNNIKMLRALPRNIVDEADTESEESEESADASTIGDGEASAAVSMATKGLTEVGEEEQLTCQLMELTAELMRMDPGALNESDEDGNRFTPLFF